MSMVLEEHDYIGISEVSSMEKNSDEKIKGSVFFKEKERKSSSNIDLNHLKATELRLGLPGSESPERENGHAVVGVLKGLLVSGAKRGFSHTIPAGGGSGKWGGGAEGGAPPSSSKPAQEKKPPQVSAAAANAHGLVAPAAKAQVVGWPPIRSFRKNSMANNSPKAEDADAKLETSCLYVKVSMDGAPYLRKVDLKTCKSYKDLSSALEKMFSCFTIGQCGAQGVHIQDGLSESHLMDLLHGSEYVLTYEDKDGDWMLVGDVPWDMFTESCKRLRITKSSDAIGLAPRAMEKCKNRN